jgi:hypothetical protein
MTHVGVGAHQGWREAASTQLPWQPGLGPPSPTRSQTLQALRIRLPFPSEVLPVPLPQPARQAHLELQLVSHVVVRV